MNLVKQLFLDRVFVDNATGPFWFADRADAVLFDFGDRIAELSETRHVLHTGIRVIAASDLRAALKQMSCHRGAGHSVPVIAAPAVMRKRRPDRQRRIRHTASNDNLRPFAQGIGDRFSTQVRIGTDNLSAAECCADLPFELGAILGPRHIINVNNGNAWRREPQLGG